MAKRACSTCNTTRRRTRVNSSGLIEDAGPCPTCGGEGWLGYDDIRMSGNPGGCVPASTQTFLCILFLAFIGYLVLQGEKQKKVQEKIDQKPLLRQWSDAVRMEDFYPPPGKIGFYERDVMNTRFTLIEEKATVIRCQYGDAAGETVPFWADPLPRTLRRFFGAMPGTRRGLLNGNETCETCPPTLGEALARWRRIVEH